MRKRVASGAVAGAATVASTVVGLMWQHIDPTAGMWILIGCGVVFLVAVAALLWPDASGEAKPALSQSTAGTGSHNISAQGDVHIHPSPPAFQERQTSHFRQVEVPVVRGLRSALAGSRLDPPKPNMNLTELLTRVYARHRPLPEDNMGKARVWQKIDFEIIDAIVENDLHVWGRYMGRARERIRMEALQKGKFNHKARTFSVPSIDTVRPMIFEDLYFNREEVDQIWPKQ